MSDTQQKEEYKSSEEVDEYGNFFFLLYKYNPLLKRVQLNIDGGKARFILTKEEFYKFLCNTCNSNVAMNLQGALNYWDTYFLFDRDKGTNKMITMKKDKVKKRFNQSDYQTMEKERIDPFYNLVGQYNEMLKDTIKIPK